MKNISEELNHHLGNLNVLLAPIASIAEYLIETGALETLNEKVPEIHSLLQTHLLADETKFYMADVLSYLGISERTYYRKIAAGKLKPRKWQGADFFYRRHLERERHESRRRGRI